LERLRFYGSSVVWSKLNRLGSSDGFLRDRPGL
jgi:hypothetical protein